MNIEQDKNFSIEIKQLTYTDDPSYDSTIENMIEICRMMDENSSIKTPEFVALVWKFIYNQA